MLGANVFSAMQTNDELNEVITEMPEAEVDVILVYDSYSESQSHSTSTSESQSFSESACRETAADTMGFATGIRPSIKGDSG